MRSSTYWEKNKMKTSVKPKTKPYENVFAMAYRKLLNEGDIFLLFMFFFVSELINFSSVPYRILTHRQVGNHQGRMD